jgi:predicted DNA-binding transcriptional regulator AlpA
MSIYWKFIQARNNTMISVQYEPALRAEELVNLAEEDLPLDERNENNVGPVIVRGENAKARPSNTEDRVYIQMDRMDSDLYKYKKVRKEFCEEYNIELPTITRKGKKYHLLFIGVKGEPLTTNTYITGIFNSQLKKAGVSLPKGYKSHACRHSKISHWVDNYELPFEKVHIKARHKSLSKTWLYYHASVAQRVKAVEKAYGLDEKSKTITSSALPQEGVLKELIKIVKKEVKEEIEDKPESVETYEIMDAIRRHCTDFAEDNLYYTFREVMDRFGLKRSQAYERIKMLKKAGKITPIKQKNNRTLYLKSEIDKYADLVDSREASIAFGYEEKTPTTIPSLAAKGIINSEKVGGLHFFDPQELIKYFYSKNK